MSYAIEIVGSFLGVSIPAWLRVFDCRKPIDEVSVLAPWTYTKKDGTVLPIHLFGSETCEVDLGLRGDGFSHGTTPTCCSGYGDTRTNEAEAHLAVTNMIECAIQHHEKWLWANAQPKSTDGGGCYYQPIAVALCNYGWSVIADGRHYVVPQYA